MSGKERDTLSSEVATLQQILEEMPSERVIDRMNVKARLESVQKALKEVPVEHGVPKVTLLFRGHPVLKSHGVYASFASQATRTFSDAVSAITASLRENLRDRGPFPDSEASRLVLTGTATGSFGFEFELPEEDKQAHFHAKATASHAVERIQDLFEQALNADGEALADVVTEVHPRAVKTAWRFLEVLSKEGALCALSFGGRSFRFQNLDQVKQAEGRLKEENIKEYQVEMKGVLQGLLPEARQFEIKRVDEDEVVRGKIGPNIDDTGRLAREFFSKQIKVMLDVTEVGESRPRYQLNAWPELAEE